MPWIDSYEKAFNYCNHKPNAARDLLDVKRNPKPSQYPYIFDSVCYGGNNAANVGMPGARLGGANGVGIHFRHGQKSNVLYLDGHALTQSPDKLTFESKLVTGGPLPFDTDLLQINAF